ncbi:hypothetical protein PIB30_003204 [Stylosanthes scabra]|uniref:Uncharacterized protein n=1 Tax=Stylosanthes scabra TaxID=79078 RepID=A0ABU6Q355_9FABA|nr:hypothetical protein [Stylosanthes scabra]
MEEDPRNPLILGRLFLATSKALIDVESGELMLRPIHQSPSDPKSYMKIEKGNPVKTAPPDKGPKKKSNEDKGKSIDYGEFIQSSTASHIPYSFVLVGSNNNASSKNVSNHFFDPP